jgi:hypothetical protein
MGAARGGFDDRIKPMEEMWMVGKGERNKADG